MTDPIPRPTTPRTTRSLVASLADPSLAGRRAHRRRGPRRRLRSVRRPPRRPRSRWSGRPAAMPDADRSRTTYMLTPRRPRLRPGGWRPLVAHPRPSRDALSRPLGRRPHDPRSGRPARRHASRPSRGWRDVRSRGQSSARRADRHRDGTTRDSGASPAPKRRAPAARLPRSPITAYRPTIPCRLARPGIAARGTRGPAYRGARTMARRSGRRGAPGRSRVRQPIRAPRPRTTVRRPRAPVSSCRPAVPDHRVRRVRPRGRAAVRG